jgi:hypothetical protein
MEDYKEKSDYESYTITRLNNGWLVEANEYKAVFQDDDDGKFKHEESESLFRLIRDTFGDIYGRWKRQGGMTIEFNDKGLEQEELDWSPGFFDQVAEGGVMDLVFNVDKICDIVEEECFAETFDYDRTRLKERIENFLNKYNKEIE